MIDNRFNYNCIAIAALCLVLSGCQEEEPQGSLYKDNSIAIENLARTYDYYLPEDLGEGQVPLIFLLHGRGGNADLMTGEQGKAAPFKVWLTIADDEHFIAVFPEGVAGSDGMSGWNDCRGDATSNSEADDVAFIRALIDEFTSQYNIDTDRIYVAGVSNGGGMSLRLAMELSDEIAASAAVIANMPANSECYGPVNPISVLFMNGTADKLMPYCGGAVGTNRGSVLSVRDSVNHWISFNNTEVIPLKKRFPNINLLDSSTVDSETYISGTEGTEVKLYTVTGGGHTEPSKQQKYSLVVESLLGRQNHDIEMAEQIWDFFQDKSL